MHTSIGPKLDLTPPLEATTLAQMIFLNRADGSGGMHFEGATLPLEAQLSPAVTVADYDGDGYEDVFVSQNFSGCAWPVRWAMREA